MLDFPCTFHLAALELIKLITDEERSRWIYRIGLSEASWGGLPFNGATSDWPWIWRCFWFNSPMTFLNSGARSSMPSSKWFDYLAAFWEHVGLCHPSSSSFANLPKQPFQGQSEIWSIRVDNNIKLSASVIPIVHQKEIYLFLSKCLDWQATDSDNLYASLLVK